MAKYNFYKKYPLSHQSLLARPKSLWIYQWKLDSNIPDLLNINENQEYVWPMKY